MFVLSCPLTDDAKLWPTPAHSYTPGMITPWPGVQASLGPLPQGLFAAAAGVCSGLPCLLKAQAHQGRSCFHARFCVAGRILLLAGCWTEGPSLSVASASG